TLSLLAGTNPADLAAEVDALQEQAAVAPNVIELKRSGQTRNENSLSPREIGGAKLAIILEKPQTPSRRRPSELGAIDADERPLPGLGVQNHDLAAGMGPLAGDLPESDSVASRRDMQVVDLVRRLVQDLSDRELQAKLPLDAVNDGKTLPIGSPVGPQCPLQQLPGCAAGERRLRKGVVGQ